jgi:hypothetical protein
MVADVKVLKPKSSCCKDKPRCKRCPVVCKKLLRQGLAERLPDGRVKLSPDVSKKQLKAARARA